MLEYTILFLNGITIYVMANDWKDAIITAKSEGIRRQFSCLEIKRIMDEDGEAINNIDVTLYTFSHVQKNSGIQAEEVILKG